jgi:hypothetical protein
MHGSDHVDLCWQVIGTSGLGDRNVKEGHSPKAQFASEQARLFHQFATRFHAVDMPLAQRLEVQVVEDEPKVGLARSMVRQGRACGARGQLRKQGFDEVEEVVHLLELAARVLVEAPVARQDVQFLEQFNRLAGPQLRQDVLRRAGSHWLLRSSRAFLRCTCGP